MWTACIGRANSPSVTSRASPSWENSTRSAKRTFSDSWSIGTARVANERLAAISMPSASTSAASSPASPSRSPTGPARRLAAAMDWIRRGQLGKPPQQKIAARSDPLDFDRGRPGIGCNARGTAAPVAPGHGLDQLQAIARNPRRCRAIAAGSRRRTGRDRRCWRSATCLRRRSARPARGSAQVPSR